MKIVLSMLAIYFVASQTLATELLPAYDNKCQSYRASAQMQCDASKKPYISQSGECGCLASEEFIDALICPVAFIRCQAGQSFYSLFSLSLNAEGISEIYEGCGCYSTENSQ